MENEGYIVNCPPLFKGEKINYWKQRMIAFFQSCHIDMWDVVEKRNYIPTDEGREPLARSKWIDEQKQRYLINSKAHNSLICSLSEEEYRKVHTYQGAKEMWVTLVVTYEGSSEVKRNKLNLLTRQYKLFIMLENENIQSMFSRFQTILNKLKSLGKSYENFGHIDKIQSNLAR